MLIQFCNFPIVKFMKLRVCKQKGFTVYMEQKIAIHCTLATLMVCCSIASCILVLSCSLVLLNSSIQQIPPSASTSAPASSCHSPPSYNKHTRRQHCSNLLIQHTAGRLPTLQHPPPAATHNCLTTTHNGQHCTLVLILPF